MLNFVGCGCDNSNGKYKSPDGDVTYIKMFNKSEFNHILYFDKLEIVDGSKVRKFIFITNSRGGVLVIEVKGDGIEPKKNNNDDEHNKQIEKLVASQQNNVC
jgi:hypothetical protein